MANSHQQSIKTGNWLFRWRSYLPLFLVLLIVPAYFEFSYPYNSHKLDLLLEFFCLSLSMFGLFIRSMTIAYTPKNTSGRNTKKQIADTLNTKGIYSTTRNPLYLGNYIIILGIALFTGVWWCPVIYSLLFFLYYERIIMAEENFLLSKFGKDFSNYCEKTPAFFPNFMLWQSADLSFSFKNILKREYNGFFAIIVCMTIIELMQKYVVENKFEFELIWQFIFFSGLAIFILLRSAKKYTTLLNVDGR